MCICPAREARNEPEYDWCSVGQAVAGCYREGESLGSNRHYRRIDRRLACSL